MSPMARATAKIRAGIESAGPDLLEIYAKFTRDLSFLLINYLSGDKQRAIDSPSLRLTWVSTLARAFDLGG